MRRAEVLVMTGRSVHRGVPVVAARAVSPGRGGVVSVRRGAGDSYSGLDDGDPMGDVSAQTGMSPDEEDAAKAQGTFDDFGGSVKS